MTSVTGTWRTSTSDLAGREPGKELPPVPHAAVSSGRVMLGADGRMMAVTCDGLRREIPGGGKREETSTR